MSVFKMSRSREARKPEIATPSSSELLSNQQQQPATAMAGSSKSKLGFLEVLAHGVKAGLPIAKQAAKVAYEQGREKQSGLKIEPKVQPSRSTFTQPQVTFSEDVPQHQHVQSFSHAPQLSLGFPLTLDSSDGDRAHSPPAPMYPYAVGPSPDHPKMVQSENLLRDSYSRSTKTTFLQDPISYDAQREHVSQLYPTLL